MAKADFPRLLMNELLNFIFSNVRKKDTDAAITNGEQYEVFCKFFFVAMKIAAGIMLNSR
jgi:hypothetical protein